MTQTPLLNRNASSTSAVQRRPQLSTWTLLAVAMLLLAAGFSSLIGPSTRGADAPLAEFSAVRAKTHVDRIAVDPHPMGSADLRLVEAYITAQLTGMGLEPEVESTEVPDYFGAPGQTTVLRNIIAMIPGTSPSGAIALVAHYDTHPATPGANDNSVGVAVLLEAARAVLAAENLTNDLVLLFTDGEEPNPRFGATAFAEADPRFADIAMVVNLEAIGSSGPSLLVETAEPETGVVDRFVSAAPNPVVFSFLTETVNLFGGVGTDFDVFKERNVPGLSFAYLRGSPIYHTAADSADSVSLSSVQHHGDNVMAVIAAFGRGALPAAGADVDSVYFTLTPFATVSYSSLVARIVAVFVMGSFAGLVWRGLASKQHTPAAIVRGLLVVLAGSLASALAAFGGWWVLTAFRSTPSMWESYAYLALLCVVAAVVLRYVGGSVAGRYADSELGAGIVAAWVLLAAITTFTVPGFSYLFVWPALGGIAALASSLSGRGSGWLWLAVSAPAVVLAIPALDAFFQMAQPRPGNPDSDLTVAVTLVGLMVALVVGLIVPFLPRHR